MSTGQSNTTNMVADDSPNIVMLYRVKKINTSESGALNELIHHIPKV